MNDLRRVLLISALAAFLPGVAEATLFVRASDAALVDAAPLIVRGVLQPLESPPEEGAPYTYYSLQVKTALRGAAVGETLRIKVPGGTTAAGLGLYPFGAPSFAAGEEALLFLHRVADGSWRIVHFQQGAFYLAPLGAARVALRDFGAATEVEAPGLEAEAERPRDLARFERWVADRLAGRVRRADYWLEPAALRELGAIAPRYNLMRDGDTGRNYRWPEFSANQQVTFQAHQVPQPGLPGGGYAEFEIALAAWTDDGDSNVRLRYGGLTGATAGFKHFDGINAIVFDDYDDASDGYFDLPFDCGTGGVLAVASPWDFGQHAFAGRSYSSIVGGDIIGNKGVSCWSGLPRRGAEALYAHELGHTIGLSHSCGSNGPCNTFDKNDAIMRSSVQNDGRGARLGNDDRLAIAFLYGAPAAPGELTATAFGSDVDLSWADLSDNERGFAISRQSGNGSVELAEVGAGTTFYTDRSGAAGQTYLYSVRAVNEVGASGASEASVTTRNPNAPTGLAVAGVLPDQLILTWVDNANGEAAYEVWGHLLGDDELLALLPANATSTILSGLIADSDYSFKVRAVGGAVGATAFSPPLVAATAPAPIGPCAADASASCLQGERFKIEVRWKDFAGQRGSGQVAPAGSADSGIFYFFSAGNWEMLVKVLDGCSINQHYWVFAAATTDVEVTLIVTDTETGKTSVYFNRLGQAAPAIADIAAFGGCPAAAAPALMQEPAAAAAILPKPDGAPAAACADSAASLCLQAERFQVEVAWTDFAGNSGAGRVVPAGSADSGLFYFFSPDNWEMLVKVLDGCAFNQRVWVYAAATTNVAYTLTVTDTATGLVKTYENLLGHNSEAITDAFAFEACP